MENLTRFVLRHRWAVLGVWIALLAAGGAASSGLADLLTNRFLLPGTDTAKVEDVLQKNFGEIPDGAFTIVARGAEQSELRAAAEQAAKQIPTAHIGSVQDVNDELSTAV